MKKIIASVFLLAAMLLGFLPTNVFAADKTKLKSLDLTIEMPKAGMSVLDAENLQLTSASSDYGDLLANGKLSILSIQWQGEFGANDDGYEAFKPGFSYFATIELLFDANDNYCANYVMQNGAYIVNGDTLKVKVNGENATVKGGTPYVPRIQVNITIPAEQVDPQEQAAAKTKRQEIVRKVKEARRGMEKAYTMSEADSLWVEKQQLDVIVMDGSDKDDEQGYYYYHLSKYNELYITKLIVDVGMESFYPDTNYMFAWYLTTLPNIRELWLSDKMDIVQFLSDLEYNMYDPDGYPWYYREDDGFFSAKGTIFIPDSALPAVKELISEYGITPVYTLKTYSGDVYSAQKAGAAAAKDWCTNHNYKKEIMASDRIYHYEDCQQDRQWYYSCSICGKCEYNPNHTFNKQFYSTAPVRKAPHQYLKELANSEAYIGTNVDGDQVYWLSCLTCSHSYNYHQTHITMEDFKESGVEGTLEQYRAAMEEELKTEEWTAINSTSTVEYPGTFIISAKSDAKTSAWAESDVNLAMHDNLIDTDLFGSDYTKSINRMQFCSVAVRLAEELIGKSIDPAPSNTFSDTNNSYVLKAYAAGITTGTSATTFSPNATLTRQQMATFIYRALRYVEKNSDYSYTSYTSKLSSYTDNGLIQQWAKEPLAFMNALDIIKGTSSTTLSPNNNCTIEQAIAVAERSIYAHQIGWYQVVTEDEKDGFKTLNYSNYWIAPVGIGGDSTPNILSYTDRIWVTDTRYGVGTVHENTEFNLLSTYLPTRNPYSGQIQYVQARWFRPIRN